MRFQIVSAPSNAPVEVGTVLTLHEAAQLCEISASELASAGMSPAGIISVDGEIRLRVCEAEAPPALFDLPGQKRRYCCAAFTEAAECAMIRLNGDGTYCVDGTGIIAATRCPWCGQAPIVPQD